MTCCSISVRAESINSATDRWQALAGSSDRLTVFDLPVWQQTWWEHFGQGKQEKILSVWSDEGQLEMLAPLMQDNGVVSFIGSTDLVDYHNVVCAGDPTDECLEAVVGELVADCSIDRLVFESLVSPSQVLERFVTLLRERGWDVSVEAEDVSPRLELAADWDLYLAGLRKKDRHELRRKLRRLEGAGDVRHVELTDREDVETGLADFFELHRKSMPDKLEFMTPEREKFFRDVCARLADEGVTRLSFLEIDQKRVAASLSFVVGTVRYLYNSGYDPEYRRLAVGLLNHAYTIRRSIEQGHTVFDFMRGDEPYKYHLGGVDREVFRITAAR